MLLLCLYLLYKLAYTYDCHQETGQVPGESSAWRNAEGVISFAHLYNVVLVTFVITITVR